MRCLTLGLFLMGLIGCSSIEPVGPLAGKWGKNSPNATAKPGKDKKSKVIRTSFATVTVPAVKPTPPLNLIYPDEVLPDNPQESCRS